MQYQFKVPDGRTVSLDLFLAGAMHLPLEKARELIEFGAVYVNGKVEVRVDRFLEPDGKVRVHAPRYGTRRFYRTDPARILYLDDWLLAYDKEAGIPSQQTPYDAHNNVYAALRQWHKSQADEAPAARLSLHHRLDQEVSGVMLLSLSEKANGPLSRAFRDKTVEKVYRAVVCGDPVEEGWVERTPIGRQGGRYVCTRPGEGKDAETAFRVIAGAKGLTLVEARPRTGRTHQIRLHLALRSLPVLGDRQYGGRPWSRCMLHALRVSLNHPVTRAPLLIEAPLPEEFRLEGF